MNDHCESLDGYEAHAFDSNGVCAKCGYRPYVTGDLDGNSEIDINDAIYILYYTFFPDEYPLNQPADFDGDGAIDINDAIYILYYTFFPEDYPLNRNNTRNAMPKYAADPTLVMRTKNENG